MKFANPDTGVKCSSHLFSCFQKSTPLYFSNHTGNKLWVEVYFIYNNINNLIKNNINIKLEVTIIVSIMLRADAGQSTII